jgi:hypothetical protein
MRGVLTSVRAWAGSAPGVAHLVNLPLAALHFTGLAGASATGHLVTLPVLASSQASTAVQAKAAEGEDGDGLHGRDSLRMSPYFKDLLS